MWIYEQITGNLYKNSRFVGTGYSGAGKRREDGRNNPEMQYTRQKGPVCEGEYKIGRAQTSPHVGPIAMHLEPKQGTNTHGRSAFMIHGDNKRNDASKGCIILARQIRHEIANSSDRVLRVVREHEE